LVQRSNVILLNICLFHGKWQWDGHTLLMKVIWNYIYIFSNTFLGLSPHICHPTRIPYLAMTCWCFISYGCNDNYQHTEINAIACSKNIIIFIRLFQKQVIWKYCGVRFKNSELT
jgi:hypothetical protein